MSLEERSGDCSRSPALPQAHGNEASRVSTQVTHCCAHPLHRESLATVSLKTLSSKQGQQGTRFDGVGLGSLFRQLSDKTSGCHRLSRTTLWSLAFIRRSSICPLLLSQRNTRKESASHLRVRSLSGRWPSFAEHSSLERTESGEGAKMFFAAEWRCQRSSMDWERRSLQKKPLSSCTVNPRS